ncbi:MAG: S8 family serine peptidase, partial [Clostridia bacterium]|nr:S8 family serine peptidase [Clostridia bacterium]
MWKKLMSGFLAVFMLISGIPVSALSIESDWIVEFGSEASAEAYLSSHDGRLLGGTLVLTRGTEEELEKQPDVQTLTKDGRVKGAAVSFNDPRKNDQDYLTDNALNVTTAWNTLDAALADKGLTEADASPIRVAVIDTGVDASHEDLKNRVTAGYDAVNGVALPAGTDSDVSDASHGTMVAGLIAAEANNSVGIAGLSYTLPVSIVPVRALDANANGKLSDIIAAIYWAVDEGDADIVNMSFGLRRQSRPAALQAAVNHAVDKGVTLIAAAGNEGRYVSYENYHYYPAALEGVLAVGSLTKSSYVRYSGYIPSYSSFTNRINTSSDVGKTFFYVAGENLLTTAKDNTYDTFTGTSASAAVFSGMMASLMSVSRAIDGVEPQAVVTTTNGGGYYSYRVSYHSFSVAASNLRSGRVMDAWWINDAHFPTLVRNSVEFSGTLMDPSYQMSGVRAVLIDGDDQVTELDAVPRVADSAGQSVSFALDSTQVADGAYRLDIIGTYASPSSEEDAEILLYEQSVTIDNAGKNYLLSVWEDGEPLIGTELTLYNADGNEMQTGHTDSLGNYPVSATAADKGGVTVVTQGEECLHIDELETHPRDNAYLFNESPATLTLTASEETLSKLGNLPVTLRLPDGNSMELATITGGSTAVKLCANCPLTFTIRGDALSLSREFSFAGGDKVWNLDEELAAATRLTVQSGFANADGVQMYVGSDRYRLPSDGGEIVLAPGEYPVKARVFKTDASYASEADYFEVDFGKVNLTADRALNIGSAVTAQMTLGQEQVVQNGTLSASFTLRDTEGNTVSDIAHSWYVEDNDISGYTRMSNFGLRFERRQEDGAWEDLDNEFMNWKSQGNGVFSVTMDTATLDNIVGNYRVRLTSTLSWPMALSEDDWKSFTVTAEETRPAARVNLSFLDFNGYRDNNAGFYVQLQDENGNWIVRKAMKPSDYKKDETYYTYLPVGETYTGAVMATCYCETDALDGYAAATAVFTVDLTDKSAGDTVDVTVQPTGEWQTTVFTQPVVSDRESAGMELVDGSDLPYVPMESAESETEYGVEVTESGVVGVTVYPFEHCPESGVTGGYEYVMEGMVSQRPGECAVDLKLRCSRNYVSVYPTVTLTHDFSESGSIAVSLPMVPTMACDREVFYSGSDVKLNYRLLDSCGNAVTSLYAISEPLPEKSRKGEVTEEYEYGYGTTVLPVSAFVKVVRSNGAAVGQYDLSDIYNDSVTLSGLADGVYTAIAVVQTGKMTTSGKALTFTVGGDVPAQPDKVVEPPVNFTAAAQSVSAIALHWDAPTDEMAQYIIYRDGKPLAEVGGDQTAYTDEGITADRYYTYTLYAVDSDGVTSEGVMAGSRPAAAPDTAAPTVPANLQAKLFGSEAVLSWSRSTDNVAVTNYIVTCDGQEVGRTYNRSFTHSGHLPGATCVYTVSAMDGAGNRSAESEPVSVTVPDVSGITSAALSYPKSKPGDIIGNVLTFNAKATADIKLVKTAVKFTLIDGTSGVRTASFVAGKRGAFSGSVSLPDEFITVEQFTLEGYKAGTADASDSRELLESPVSRGNAVTLTLTNTHNKKLPDFAKKVNVTLKGNGDRYSVTRTVENFAGSVLCFPPNGTDYTFTVTAEDGRELYALKDITVDGEREITADAENMARLLRVRLTGFPEGVETAGLAVNMRSSRRTFTGVTDSQGYVVWSKGNQWLSVSGGECYVNGFSGKPYLSLGSDAQTIMSDDTCYEIRGLWQECYVSDWVNELTVKVNTQVYEMKTITARLRDYQGHPLKGLTVDIAGRTHENVVTDENGVASARVGLYCYNWGGTSRLSDAYVSVPTQFASDGRIWCAKTTTTKDSCDITLTAESNKLA